MAPTVMVIESRSPEDHYQGRREGEGLCELLRLCGIEHVYREVTDRTHFIRAFEEVSACEPRYVHISCHGDADGFRLTDGDIVNWDEFHDFVWHGCDRALGDCVLVFSASAVGEGVGVLLEQHRTFCARIVAPTRRITWQEGLAAYSSFYFRSTWETGTTEDVALMNDLVGSPTFVQFKGHRSKTYRTV